jgi:hypothetical protein
LDNIPEFIEEIYIHSFQWSDETTVTKLPITIKKIYIDTPDVLHYIKKIPFGCIITNITPFYKKI